MSHELQGLGPSGTLCYTRAKAKAPKATEWALECTCSLSGGRDTACAAGPQSAPLPPSLPSAGPPPDCARFAGGPSCGSTLAERFRCANRSASCGGPRCGACWPGTLAEPAALGEACVAANGGVTAAAADATGGCDPAAICMHRDAASEDTSANLRLIGCTLRRF